MHGPIAAAMRCGAAPSSIIAATVASSTPPSAPRQPACAAPMMRAAGSAKSIGARPVLAPPRPLDDHHLRAVHLMAGDEAVGCEVERGRGATAVLEHLGLRVARAEPAIERREQALADAAGAGEEGVTDAVGVERVAGDQAAGSSAKPAGAGSAR